VHGAEVGERVRQRAIVRAVLRLGHLDDLLGDRQRFRVLPRVEQVAEFLVGLLPVGIRDIGRRLGAHPGSE